jgi:cellulose biosynthesis protein BcsQ
LIKTDFEQHLLPITIHRDENLREAFVFKKPVLECAPASQSAQDFSLAALWLTARQAHLADLHESRFTGPQPQ